MDLIIVESPTKARTLSKFLGSAYNIQASMGHVRDLPESRLGIDVEKDFEPTYVVSDKKKDKVKELQELAKKATNIILATDPDREGEAISWHIAQLLTMDDRGLKIGKENRKLKIDKKNLSSSLNSQPLSSTVNHPSSIQRITFHEITESAIKEALSRPGTINMPMVDAQQARRILDRLVGYKLSPLLWRKIRKGLSAGRVQSVAVRLIVEREREIKAFVPQEYWEIVANLKSQTSNLKSALGFEAKLVKIGEEKAEIKTKEQADKITADLEKAKYSITDVQKKEVKRNPFAPFTTSTLQQAASNLMGWSAKRTMQIAQNLYEMGLITYHRTDSTNLAIEAVTAARNYIISEFGEKYLPEEPRLFKTKSKVAQEAHEAIRPTAINNLQLTIDNSHLDRDQHRLYELIWKRFLACQMKEAVYEQTGVDISATCHSGEPKATPESLNVHKESDSGPVKILTNFQGKPGQNDDKNYYFRANGNRQVFDGWQRLFNKASNSVTQLLSNDEDEGGAQVLPELTAGEILQLIKLLPTQHFTQPPPRFNEASLIKTLEEFGIGRPSTYAPIISTIQDRQYVEKVDKRFFATALGMAVNDFLMTNFPKLFDFQFTAHMEDDLDEIANGTKQLIPVLHEFYDPFSELLLKVDDSAERVKVEVEETGEMCPNDGSSLVVRIGKFGKFIACSKFPDCKFTRAFTKKIDVKCPKCQIGEIIIKRTRSKKTFYGCSRYPDCDFASWNKPKAGEIVAASTV